MRMATSFKSGSPFLRARNGAALSESELRGVVPSIFAEGAHASRSARYEYIPTIDIVRGLEKEGFAPTFACQAMPRADDKIGHAKHMIRFRRPDEIGRPEARELIMVNSHDGSTSYQLMGGVFRFVCTNGMICGDKFEEIRVRHKGNIVDDVIEGSFRIVEDFERVADSVQTMKSIALKPAEQLLLAEGAATIRFDLQPGDKSPVRPESFLRTRRADDASADLWTTFNRVQENTIRGGLHGSKVDANGRRRAMSTREINGIDQNVALNRALWSLSERMAELKAAG